MTVSIVVLLAATIAAAATDLRVRRIPNALTASLAVVGLALHVPQGPLPLLLAIGAFSIAFALGSAAFAAGWFGGGDVKLIAGCCGLVGAPGSVTLAIDILICGALLALFAAARRNRLGALLRSTVGALHGAPTERIPLPYGVAIAAGSIVYAASTALPASRFPL